MGSLYTTMEEALVHVHGLAEETIIGIGKLQEEQDKVFKAFVGGKRVCSRSYTPTGYNSVAIILYIRLRYIVKKTVLYI